MADIQNWMRALFGGSRNRAPYARAHDPAVPQGLAAQLYLDRRAREACFTPGLFREPAWDILLYMFDAEEAGTGAISVRGLAKAPFSISLDSVHRWVDLLVSSGYVEPVGRTGSKGRPCVQLTSLARKSMARYLRSIT